MLDQYEILGKLADDLPGRQIPDGDAAILVDSDKVFVVRQWGQGLAEIGRQPPAQGADTSQGAGGQGISVTIRSRRFLLI